MSWRYVVVSRRSKLDLKYDNLIIRNEDGTVDIHLSEIGTLVLESTAISITVALMARLVERKIKVVLCDDKRDPCSELIPYYGCYDSSLKIKEQIGWKSHTAGLVWKEIVKDKIIKQANTLKYNNKSNYELLMSYVDEVEIHDETNREGHAAKVYFNSFFGKGFCRDDETAINAALNYGYKIILSNFNRELSSQGYLTQLGIFHSNQFNHFNLSSDLMEPYRVIVDDLVYNEKFEVFGTEEKRILQTMNEKQVIIDGKKQYLPNSIKIYTRSIMDALKYNDLSYIRFYEYEL